MLQGLTTASIRRAETIKEVEARIAAPAYQGDATPYQDKPRDPNVKYVAGVKAQRLTSSCSSFPIQVTADGARLNYSQAQELALALIDLVDAGASDTQKAELMSELITWQRNVG